MARSPEGIFKFWKQKKVTASQIWWIWWLSNNFCFVFSQKSSLLWPLLVVLFAKHSGLSIRVRGDALHTQNMNHNMLSRSIRDVESLCYLSNTNTTIFEHNFLHFFCVIVVNRGGWTTCMRQVLYDPTTLTECFMSFKYLRSR